MSEIVNKIINMYSDGKSMNEIARELDVSTTLVAYYLKSRQVVYKTKSDTLKERRVKTLISKLKNKNYLDNKSYHYAHKYLFYALLKLSDFDKDKLRENVKRVFSIKAESLINQFVELLFSQKDEIVIAFELDIDGFKEVV